MRNRWVVSKRMKHTTNKVNIMLSQLYSRRRHHHHHHHLYQQSIHPTNQYRKIPKEAKMKNFKMRFPFRILCEHHKICKLHFQHFHLLPFAHHIPISYTFTQAIILIFALQPNDFHDIQIEHKQGNFTSTSLSFGVSCHTFAQLTYYGLLTCFAFYALKQRTYNVSNIKKSLLFESFLLLQAFFSFF